MVLNRAKKFAWFPIFIKCGGGLKALIWLQGYWVAKTQRFPSLCDCVHVPCAHSPKDDYYKYPVKRLGFFN